MLLACSKKNWCNEVSRLKIHSNKRKKEKNEKKRKQQADFIERSIVKIRTSPLFSPHLFLASFSASRFQHRTLAGWKRGRKPPEPESLFIEGDKHFYGPLANYYFLQPPLLDLCRQHPSSTISLTFLHYSSTSGRIPLLFSFSNILSLFFFRKESFLFFFFFFLEKRIN